MQENENKNEEASDAVVKHLRCPRCSGISFHTKPIPYIGKTIVYGDIVYEDGDLLSRCARCRLPVPHQERYFVFE
jgi:uncharacterized C2H2 Zn-finger protein